MSSGRIARESLMPVGAGELAGVVELHPALVALAMLGGLAATVALAWVLPDGAGGPVFVLGLMVFVVGWPFLVALHLEETFGAFTEVRRWLVTACYLAALVLLPLALVVIELTAGVGWSLLFLLAWGGGCVAAVTVSMCALPCGVVRESNDAQRR